MALKHAINKKNDRQQCTVKLTGRQRVFTPWNGLSKWKFHLHPYPLNLKRDSKSNLCHKCTWDNYIAYLNWIHLKLSMFKEQISNKPYMLTHACAKQIRPEYFYIAWMKWSENVYCLVQISHSLIIRSKHLYCIVKQSNRPRDLTNIINVEIKLMFDQLFDHL